MKPNLLSFPTSEMIVFGGLTYLLEGETRWSAQYRSGKHILVVSKILEGLFDMSWLKINQPSDLPANERNPAAVALYAAGQREDIPAVWRDFAVDICGPNSAFIKKKDAEQVVDGNPH